jgi:hypothetical protein
VREQDELGFYSRAKDFVMNQRQDKFDGQQLKGAMLNSGVKPDELKWTGLDQFLDKNKTVTKQQVADYLDQNKVELTEVVLSGTGEYGIPTPLEFTRSMQKMEISDFELEEKIQIAMEDKDIREVAAERYIDANDFPYDVEKVADLYFEKKADVEREYPDIDYDEMIATFNEVFEEQARGIYDDYPDYINSGQVELPDGDTLDWEIFGNDDMGWNVIINGEPQGNGLSADEALVRVEAAIPKEGGVARWSDHTQKGGGNYRELLLTNTTYKGAAAEQTGKIASMLDPAQQQRLDDLRVKAREGTITSDELRIYGALEEMEGKTKVPFNEPIHYPDEEDIVAHIRVKDRETADGDKVLYIEELQSDWAQRGRAHGISEPREPKIEKIDYPETGETAYRVEGTGRFETREFSTYTDAKNSANRQLETNMEERVPSGPFIDKTDQWTALAMRRIIREAADGDYDYIAWSPGQVQYDRWREDGLIEFYDKVIPNATNKVAKNLDKKSKTEVVKVNIGNKQQDTLALRISDKIKKAAKEGQPMFAIPAAIGAGAAIKGTQQQQGENDGNT